MPTATKILTHTMTSPLGTILLTADGDCLTGLAFDAVPPADAVGDRKWFQPIVAQLNAYFAGDLTQFTIPYHQPGTDFQERVWKQLARISFGKCVSYADIAVKLAQPQASRAVGNANGKNAICVVVPCHRVIASDGTLGGYSSGLWRKEWLLRHERGEAPVHKKAR
jgi:methylated-DNA-[protein]-cysteine S-methyltransferase